MLKIGDNVAGNEIIAKLSAGGMATLYLGRKQGAGGFAKHVAIKVVHPHLAEDDSFVEMFLDEARLSARIDHPNVVQVYDLGEHNGAYYMVMEFIGGCSLGQLLRTLAKKKMRLAPEVAVSIAAKLASALHAAHELCDSQGQNLGVVHRDVSPQNVLLAFRGHVKLIDFGIAKAADRSQQTQGSVFKGKLRYAAPEQAMGKPLDRRADIYALGIVLWEMLTTHRLFDGESDFEVLEQVRNPVIRAPGMIVDGIPAAVDAVVLEALATNPNDRPATGEIFRQKLAQACPAALAIEPSHISDLLSVLMQEFVESEQRKLSTLSAVSQILGTPQNSSNAVANVEHLVAPLQLQTSKQDLDSALPTSAPRMSHSGSHAGLQPRTQAPTLTSPTNNIGVTARAPALRAAQGTLPGMHGATALAIDPNTAPIATEASKIKTSSRAELEESAELDPVTIAAMAGALPSEPPKTWSPHLRGGEGGEGDEIAQPKRFNLLLVLIPAALIVGALAAYFAMSQGSTSATPIHETLQPVAAPTAATGSAVVPTTVTPTPVIPMPGTTASGTPEAASPEQHGTAAARPERQAAGASDTVRGDTTQPPSRNESRQHAEQRVEPSGEERPHRERPPSSNAARSTGTQVRGANGRTQRIVGPDDL